MKYTNDAFTILMRGQDIIKEGDCVVRRCKVGNGYWMLTIIDSGGNKRTISEHRYVWECFHGKPEKYEVIHHINGDKGDNSISNLEAMSRSRHNQLHWDIIKRTICANKMAL